MLPDLVKLCAGALDMEWIKKHSLALYELEKLTSHKDFLKSTDYLLQVMQEAGFSDIERYALPCDGVTTYDDCTMPLAWNRTGRSTLEMVFPEQRLLADSDVQPVNAVIWSPPTPAGGVTAELVSLRSAVSEDFHEFAGKIVLWDDSPSAAKKLKLIQAGALGIVAYVDAIYDTNPDDVRWMNGVGLRGWYYTKDDPQMWVFSITPRIGRELEERLAAGEKIRLKAVMNTEVSPGEIYTVTGVIPGKSSREHALVAHMYEPFVTDDATGTILSVAIGKALKELSEQGKIPALENGFRVVFSMERYGFSEFFNDPERSGKIISAFNMDSVCYPSLKMAGTMPELRHSPVSAPGADAVIVRNLLKESFPGFPFNEVQGNLSDDTFPADSTIGIPCSWLHTVPAPARHHNTGSIFNDPDWEIAGIVAATIAALHAKFSCAAAGIGREELLTEVTEGVLADAKSDFERLKQIEYFNASDKEIISSFLAEHHARRILSLNRSIPGAADEETLRKLFADIFPQKQAPAGEDVSGINWVITRAPGFSQLMSFARVPVPERYTALRMPQALMMGLLDGRRTLHEAFIIAKFFLKMTPAPGEEEDVAKTFEFIEKYNYCTIRK